MKRRFEQGDRFWEVDDTNFQVVMISWGAAGKPTQRIDRDFRDREASTAYVEKHIAAQVAKGYVEVAEREPPPPPLPESRQIRFEWNEGGERHFFEVLMNGLKVHHRTGSVVDRPQTLDLDTQRFPTLAAANARFDELCAEARAKGREEIDPVLRAAAAIQIAQSAKRDVALRKAEPSYSELEAQCLEARESPEPWIVYADFLEANGDVRGQIAALARAGKSVDRLILDQLLGIADDDDVEEDERGSADHELRFQFELHHGFVRYAQIAVAYDAGIELDVATRRFLATPLARFVDSLRFGLSNFEGDNDWTPTLRAVVESEQAHRLRALAFDCYTSEDSEISWVAFGDFGGLLDQLPVLESLRIRSGLGGTYGAFPPSLKTLVRESGGMARVEIAAILGAEWPNLEHLELWTGSRYYNAECALADLDRVLTARELPRLRHLGIVNSELVDELIPALARSRILPQLESLDLSRGIAAGDASDALVAHASAFRHLASFDLSQNMFNESQTERIRSVLDNVIVDAQRPYSDERYVALGE